MSAGACVWMGAGWCTGVLRRPQWAAAAGLRRASAAAAAAAPALAPPNRPQPLARPCRRRFGHGIGFSLLTILSTVAVDFLAVGAGIATGGWALSNRFLRRKNQHSHAVEQSVEWCAAPAAHAWLCWFC